MYYELEHIAASVEINKQERAHAKRDVFVLMVVVRAAEKLRAKGTCGPKVSPRVAYVTCPQHA